MTTMRQTMSTNMTSHDNNLDALLEELQTSVSRPGSSLGMNGMPVSGYREVTRTVTTEGSGQPGGKTTEYHIEYLNPANTTTVLADNYAGHNRDLGLLKQSELPAGSNLASYKTVQYEYKTSGSQNVAAPGMRQNITELDSLLDDLHTAQKTGFADSGTTKHVQGIDPGLLEPIENSTPHGGHVSRSVEKRSYQEQRYGSVGRQSPARERDVKRELVFTGGSKRDQTSPSPVQQRKEIYRYETHKTTRTGNSRDMSPPQDRRQLTNSSPSPNRHATTVRSYNYSSSDQDVPRASTMHRSPSPAGKNSNTSVRTYNYSTNQRDYNSNQRDFSPDTPRSNRSQSPTTKVTTVRTYNYNTPEPPRAPPPAKITSINSYNYSSTTRETNKHPSQEVPRTPPPHRSPSPVSFAQPPLPSTKTTTVKTYNFEGSPRPQSPQPIQKFSPSDPSRTLTYQVSPPPAQPQQPTVITYKYSSTSTHSSKYPGEEGAPLLPRPFPTPSPTPDQQQQQPPKKLDELMASFSDSEIQQQHESSNRYYPGPREHVTPVRLEATPPPASVAPVQPTSAVSSAAATAAAMQVKSKNVTGPPVYYPPGVELFAKKEESSFQQQSGGGMMKAKAKYEYEASSKSKSKSSSSKTVVPVCLPVCCAMPCSIL